MLAILNLSQIAPEADFLLLSAIDMERRSALGNRPARHCDRPRGLLRDPHGNRERNRKFVDSPLEGDGFELPVREHRAMAPSHGFPAASHRGAALRGAPATHGETASRGAAGFRE